MIRRRFSCEINIVLTPLRFQINADFHTCDHCDFLNFRCVWNHSPILARCDTSAGIRHPGWTTNDRTVPDVSSCCCWYLHWRQISIITHRSPHQIHLNRLLGIPCLFHPKLGVLMICCRVQVILMIQIANYAIILDTLRFDVTRRYTQKTNHKVKFLVRL